MSAAPKPTPVMFRRPGTWDQESGVWKWEIGDLLFALSSPHGDVHEVTVATRSEPNGWRALATAMSTEEATRRAEELCRFAHVNLSKVMAAMGEGDAA